MPYMYYIVICDVITTFFLSLIIPYIYRYYCLIVSIIDKSKKKKELKQDKRQDNNETGQLNPVSLPIICTDFY